MLDPGKRKPSTCFTLFLLVWQLSCREPLSSPRYCLPGGSRMVVAWTGAQKRSALTTNEERKVKSTRTRARASLQ